MKKTFQKNYFTFNRRRILCYNFIFLSERNQRI
jgi:hypothetical protein